MCRRKYAWELFGMQLETNGPSFFSSYSQRWIRDLGQGRIPTGSATIFGRAGSHWAGKEKWCLGYYSWTFHSSYIPFVFFTSLHRPFWIHICITTVISYRGTSVHYLCSELWMNIPKYVACKGIRSTSFSLKPSSVKHDEAVWIFPPSRQLSKVFSLVITMGHCFTKMSAGVIHLQNHIMRVYFPCLKHNSYNTVQIVRLNSHQVMELKFTHAL